ncbi:MAG TPA: hypothetical protein VJX10_18800 [Pseudonocardiaceae bacterium]|nr:hypothetical protein [Pseudonocardiaceae bacterium]
MTESTAAAPTRRAPARGRCLTLLTGVAWALVATMRYWWSWLWDRLGVLSVPVDIVVWVLAIILTILVVPVLWHRFHRAWPVVFVVAVLVVGGTAIVLAPWHDALTRAWMRTECGTDYCVVARVTIPR